MAGPIATLTVRLSAQISELQKSFSDGTKVVTDFKSSFEKNAAAIQGSIDGIGKTFEKFGSVLGTLAVAGGAAAAAGTAIAAGFKVATVAVETITGAISDAVASTLDLGDELFTLSQKTGVSVESLSALKFVAGQTGTSLESISGAVFKLEANLGKGTDETKAAVASLGLSLADLRKQAPEEAFASLLTKLGEIPSATQRAATGVAIFGKSFKDVAQLSREDLPALISKARELGLVMSTETAVAADRFNDAMGELRGRFEGLQQQLGAKVIPALVAFAEAFGTILSDAFKAVAGNGQRFAEIFDTVVVQVGQGAARLIEVFGLLTSAVAEWVSSSITRFKDEANAFLTLAETIIGAVRLVDLAQNGGQGAAALDVIERRLESTRSTINSLAATAKDAGASIATFAHAVATAAVAAGDGFAATYARIQAEITTAANTMRAGLANIGEGGLAKPIKQAKEESRQLLNFVRFAVADINQKINDIDTKQAEREMQDFSKEVVRSIQDVGKAWDWLIDKTEDQSDFVSAVKASITEVNIGWNDLIRRVEGNASRVATPFRDAFLKLGADLPELLARGFQQGGITGAFASVAQAASSEFGRVFADAMTRAVGDSTREKFESLTTTEQWAGVGALAAGAFAQGFQTGLQGGGGAGNLALSFGSGFLTGFLATGGNAYAGLATGAAQFFGAIIGGAKNAREETQRLIQSQRDLVRQYGGSTELAKLIDRAGGIRHDFLGSSNVLLGGKGAVDLLTDSRLSTEEYNRAIGELNDALAAYERRIKALSAATEALNARTGVFAARFAPLVEARKGGDAGAGQAIQELAQRTQPEFERLGLFVRDTFAGIVRTSGDAIGAITALAPSFEVLKAGITDFGLTSTATIDALLASFDLVNDAAFKPLFENIQTAGTLFQSLDAAKALSPDAFQAAAADIGQSIQEIINKGGDMAKTYALSQPQLQALWEAQEKYGLVTDQTTQSILQQAQQQGIVGAQFKATQEKVLDVLLAIADALHAKIPDGLRTTASAATATGQTITNTVGASLDGLQTKARSAAGAVSRELAGIQVPDITINARVKVPGDYGPYTDDWMYRDVPALASGAIVRRPTLALVGEAGPEAVVPLQRLQRLEDDPVPQLVFSEGSIVLQGIDGPSIAALVESGAFAESLRRQLTTNSRGLATTVRRVTA